MDGLERSCSISRNEKRDFADGKLRPLISTQRLRNLVPVISLLFLRSCIAYASVTCRFDRLGPIGWRVFDSCLPRNGGATFQYRTIPRFINIHSWNEVIYMCWYHLLKRSSLLHVDQTLFLSNTRANRQERCTSTLQIEPFHRQELITRNFHRWKREEERESIEEPETWLNGSIPRVRPDALIPAINSSTCLVAMGRSLWKRIVIFVGESLR